MSKLIDLTGRKIGKLTVTDRASNGGSGHVRWNCICDCGRPHTASRKSLINESATCCWVCMGNVDLTGQQFGRLTVIEPVGNSKNFHHAKYWCKCTCGNKIKVRRPHLFSGNTKSCGCLRLEQLHQPKKPKCVTCGKLVSKNNQQKYLNVHLASCDFCTSLFLRWYGMHDRCYNKSHQYYKNAGAKGIIVTKEWYSETKSQTCPQFKHFVNWCVSAGLTEENYNKYKITRRSNLQHYSPKSCYLKPIRYNPKVK